MVGLIRKQKPIEEEETTISGVLSSSPQNRIVTPIDTSLMISSGSTLLDLAISGGRVRGGGIPGGIMMEIFGPSSSGKSTILVEIGASIQNKGGEVHIEDPEARLDKSYTEMHGLSIPADEYKRPDTVSEVFESIRNWSPKNENVLNLFGADSIAALSSEMEMSEDGDKRGQKKAKDLSEGCRKTARLIAQENKLIVFTNQERQSEFGKTTPGGFAVGYHSSVRLRVARTNKIEPEKTLANKKKVKKVIGIQSEVVVVKSSVDDEYRKAPIYIIFGFGIDDVRANLQWYKDFSSNSKYLAVDKEYQVMDAAIRYIEENNLEADLREMVIDLWMEIEAKFKMDRKRKIRF